MSDSLVAARATRALNQAVSMKWFDAAPRVQHWSLTITSAYHAYIAGNPTTLVEFPEDATTRDGLSYDTAENVLDAFNDWLGRDIVWEALDWAQDENRDGE